MLPTIIQSNFNIGLSLSKILTVSFSALVLVGCGKADVAQQAPPPAVSVYQIKTQEIGKYREFVARTVASKEASLRARVEGELLERLFQEGANVEAEQVLLKIDPAEYIASVTSAKADLASKVAGANGAASDLKRGKKIASDGFISQSDLDKLITNEAQTKAAVRVAKAALEKAELNLSYTNIIAPFAGRIGKVNYNVGNVIGPASDVLATLTLTNPMNVSFQVEESLYISYLQENEQEQQTNGITKPRVNISIRLPNNTLYSESGVLDFSDTKIDQSMGTVELRALFDNPHGIILPGLFVTLILESQDKEKMSLVPQAAVQENQQGTFVLVIKDNKVSQRHLVLGRRINSMWVVDSGLSLGEEVIIEGLQKVRPGVEVKSVYKTVDYLTGTISDITDDSTYQSDEKG
jgi:membrane fusion protein (multidrug efflux system)